MRGSCSDCLIIILNPDQEANLIVLMINLEKPEFILYAQHGWADNSLTMAYLARVLAPTDTLIITPDLGWWRTWLRITPLIQEVEANLRETISKYPNIPIKIIGHSLGGLIWLEILNKYPQWWQKIHSLVLIASPIGGAHLARIIDPLGLGIGIAKALGKNRRQIAEKIAQVIPTLIIAGDLGKGTDGTISVESTRFDYAKFVCLAKINHPDLRHNSEIFPVIHDFWQQPLVSLVRETSLAALIINKLRTIPGITDGDWRYFPYAKPYLVLADGITISLWQNSLRIDYVFVSNAMGECLYAGFVGWLHLVNLFQTLELIKIDTENRKLKD